MGDFRTRYGSALGPYGPVYEVSSRVLLPSNDATPDVTDGTFFLTNNAVATAISYFDVLAPGGLVSLNHSGKRILLFINDNNTTIANAGQIFLAGSGAAMTSGTIVEFIYYNSAWYETNRSENLRSDVVSLVQTGTVAPNIADIKVAILIGTGGSTTVITGLSGGYPGQFVTLMKDATAVLADTAIKLLSTGDFQLSGTNALLMNASMAYMFVADVGSRFRQIAPAAVP